MKRGNGCILFIYFIASLPDLFPLSKVEPFLSNMLKVFYQDYFVPYRGYFIFMRFSLSLSTLIFWTWYYGIPTCTGGDKSLFELTPSSTTDSLPSSLEEFHQHLGVQHQIKRPHKNIEYLQDIPYHRKVLVTYHYHNHHQTYTCFFINSEDYFVEIERYI